jgi:nucleoside-diphosphate kinase
MQTTLIILKPDAVQRGLMGRILTRFEDKGLQVVGCKLVQPTRQMAETHYGVHRDKPFFDSVCRFLSSAPVLILALRGINAIDISRKMMGATFGSRAEPGTIRGDFGVSNSFNLIHGSDAPETAAKELALWFKDGEIVEYDRALQPWIYDHTGGKPE